MMKRYFKTRNEAQRYLESLGGFHDNLEIHKQPKGTRHHGMYYLGTYLEWLNFAN